MTLKVIGAGLGRTGTMSLKLALENDDRTRWIAIFIGSERDAQHTLAAEDAKASD